MKHTMHIADYTDAAGELAVLVDAVAIPVHVSENAAKIYFGNAGRVISQEIGIDAEIYSAVGTIGMHRDSGFENGLADASSLGLVLLNENGCCLTDGDHILPLAAGTVFRHHPGEMHGTCLPDGSRSDTGRFVFISYSYNFHGDEDRPQDFAAWALPDAENKLASLLPNGELRYPMRPAGR
jgi:hypothetical protein